jgi:predicted GH43/DUF377 family glycosyl hydrolase
VKPAPSRRTVLRGAAAVSLSPALAKFGRSGTAEPTVPDWRMREVYEEVLTPYKYGVVVENDLGFADGACVFRLGADWYMTYFVEQQTPSIGYTTELARSEDLLHWEHLETLLPFRPGAWDSNQAAGSIALPSVAWGGSQPQTYDGKYWMSYFGDNQAGFEPGPLAIGVAGSPAPLSPPTWTRLDNPVLNPQDANAHWWDNYRQFRSTVIYDPARTLGMPFVMFYNARGGTINTWSERIGMAVSPNMTDWVRYGANPVISNDPIDFTGGISGDPQIVRMGDLWVMFYYGAFWRNGAFNTFACSCDLVNWTKWSGPMIMASTKSYDRQYAHKPWIVKHSGTVYQFYTAVGDNRSIAVATSRDLSGTQQPGSEQVTTSYTYWENSDSSVVDGITDPGTSPQGMWTAFGTPNFDDWIELAFPSARSIAGLRIYFHDDGGQIQPPGSYHVEYDAGGGWAIAASQERTPNIPAAGANTVTFGPVAAKRIRLYMHHLQGAVVSGGIYSGVTEIEILGSST